MTKRIRTKVKTRYGVHEVVLEKDEKGYVVEAPDLEGVLSWGKNIKEAKKMVQEAIELCIECLVEEEGVNISQRTKSNLTA